MELSTKLLAHVSTGSEHERAHEKSRDVDTPLSQLTRSSSRTVESLSRERGRQPKNWLSGISAAVLGRTWGLRGIRHDICSGCGLQYCSATTSTSLWPFGTSLAIHHSGRRRFLQFPLAVLFCFVGTPGTWNMVIMAPIPGWGALR